MLLWANECKRVLKNEGTLFLNNIKWTIISKGSNKKPYDALYSIDDHAPELLSLYLGKKIALESMVILNDLENYLDKWEPLIMLWNDEFRLIRKVKKFVKYNPDVVKSIYNRYKEGM